MDSSIQTLFIFRIFFGIKIGLAINLTICSYQWENFNMHFTSKMSFNCYACSTLLYWNWSFLALSVYENPFWRTIWSRAAIHSFFFGTLILVTVIEPDPRFRFYLRSNWHESKSDGNLRPLFADLKYFNISLSPLALLDSGVAHFSFFCELCESEDSGSISDVKRNLVVPPFPA